MELNVLLVEDDPHDMKTYLRDFPPVFEAAGLTVKFEPAEEFEKAKELIKTSYVRFDLILSDTFRGELKNLDAAVIDMVKNYRQGRFCPLVVFSASARPDDLKVGAFVIWADKTEAGNIESAIKQVLETGIPQLARTLHDELDRTAGGFLWDFLETNWERLWPEGSVDTKVLERLIRRRAALQLAEVSDIGGALQPLTSIAGLEYYVYPPLHERGLSLGHIITNRHKAADIRVVLTPHCHLTVQADQQAPRAEYVLTVKAIASGQVLGAAKIANAKALGAANQDKKLKSWSSAPSKEVGKPAGRYWYLPAFLEIPHSFCDFQQLDSLPHAVLVEQYEPIAVLSPPFAESLQACFISYHAGVGIPDITPDSIRSILG
jgi:hypothetical protein